VRRLWPVVVVVGILTVPMSAGASAAASNHDKAIAQAAVLTLPDFPSGWTAKPQSGGDSNGGVEAKLVSSIPKCRPFVPLLANAKTGVRAVTTSDFTDGVTTVNNDVRVYPTVPNALKAFAALQSPALTGCFQRLLQAALKAQLVSQGQAKNVRIAGVSVEPANPNLNAGGDGQGGFAATITVAASGQQENLYVESLTVRVGRALDTFSYQNVTGPVSDLAPGAAAASVSRLQAALAG